MDFEPAIVERLVVSPNAAEAILSMEFTEADRERMRQLVDENNKGTLTADELVEMEGYRRVGTFLGLMQSKARLLLRKEALDHSKKGMKQELRRLVWSRAASICATNLQDRQLFH